MSQAYIFSICFEASLDMNILRSKPCSEDNFLAKDAQIGRN